MVSQKNVQTVKEVTGQLKKYPVIGILDMHALPASQLHKIRTLMRGKAVIRMVKKTLLTLAIKEADIKGVDELNDKLQGQPALLLSEENPFKLAMMVDKNKSEAPAKEGDISPKEIMIPAGPTSLPPGPVIGEFQKARIPATIEGDKIHVKEDTVVAKEGDEISGLLAGLLAKLGVSPMEIGLNMICALEKGTIYGKDILFIPQEKYVSDLVACHQNAFNLAFSAGYPTKDTMPILLSKAHQEAFSLASEAGIMTSETVKPLLAKANAQMAVLKSKLDLSATAEAPTEPESPPEKPADSEAKEEKPAEEVPTEADKPTDPKVEDKPAEEPKEEAKTDKAPAEEKPADDTPVDESKDKPKAEEKPAENPKEESTEKKEKPDSK